MRAEVIAIGDELVSGQRTDTNSGWLSRQLADLGVRVLRHTVVGDDLSATAAAFRQAGRGAEIVVCTGGLGPTADDLTRHALAEVAGRPLQMDHEVLDQIRHLFARRGSPMPASNEIQAMFPEGSRVMPNPHGTAPGIDLAVQAADGRTARFFALPGVPAEMRQMWQETIAPTLRSMGAGLRMIRHRRIKCFGIGESTLEQMLPDLVRRGRSPSVGITVHQATITLRLTAEETSAEACDAAMRPTIDTIMQCLGDLVFGEEDDELQHAVARLMADQRVTLATAEWGTDGLVAYWLRSIEGLADLYRGGLVAPSWEAVWGPLVSGVESQESRVKSQETAGESRVVAEGEGEVPNESSARLTGAVAARLRTVLRTDFALATGPRSGLGGRHEPATTFHVALASQDGVSLVEHPLAGHPDIVVARAAKQALNCLRLHLVHRDRMGPRRS